MPLWKLQPLDLSDPNWEASSHRGVVVVRAPDEETARDEAGARVWLEDAARPRRRYQGRAFGACLACLSRAGSGPALRGGRARPRFFNVLHAATSDKCGCGRRSREKHA